MSTLTLERRYHVPRSQVWEGSRGAQHGKVHLHLAGDAELPLRLVAVTSRIRRRPGQALCGRRGWYERPPDGARELRDDALCPRCVDIATRAGAST